MTELDRRLYAFRSDLADERLRGRVAAGRFAAGTPAAVAVPVADIKAAPSPEAGVDSQLLLGDAVVVFDKKDGWAWIQSVRDAYVGYVRADALAEHAAAPTHVVAAPRSFVFSRDDLKSPRVEALSMGSGVVVSGHAETRGTRYALLAGGGAMIAAHLSPAGQHASDYVSVAETLEQTPYLWGGTSGFGLDCSGLVQLAMRMAGGNAPRDTDMQERTFAPVNPAGLRRGDLVFWKGHVAVMLDAGNVIHANGHTMLVSRETLAEAIGRIEPVHGVPTSCRRPQ